MAFAYIAGGCFWCITPVFARHTGVLGVKSGYSGGREQNPTYEAVKHQQTGHRETIRVEYDPEAVSFGELLELFLQNTDPFDADGQFIDRGHSYTLAVYWQTAAEKLLAAGLPFEINTGAISRGYRKEPYPDRPILDWLKARGAALLLSSDSHRADTLAWQFDRWAPLLDGARFFRL